MSTVTEYFNSHLVPRLTIGEPVDPGSGAAQNLDGYAFGQEISVGTDGYVMDLRMNTVYSLQTRTQDIYYGMLSDTDQPHNGKHVQDMDDSEKLALLDVSGTKNGHFLDDAVSAAHGPIQIATTRLCHTIVIKSATGTATVNLCPLGSYVDDAGSR